MPNFHKKIMHQQAYSETHRVKKWINITKNITNLNICRIWQKQFNFRSTSLAGVSAFDLKSCRNDWSSIFHADLTHLKDFPIHSCSFSSADNVGVVTWMMEPRKSEVSMSIKWSPLREVMISAVLHTGWLKKSKLLYRDRYFTG